MKKCLIWIICIGFLFNSCNGLKENPYSVIVSENFYLDEDEIIASVAPAYGALRKLANWTWILEELCTDEMVLPTRGLGEWYDGGIYQRYHEHTWTAETDGLLNSWQDCYDIINICNMVIFQLQKSDKIDDKIKNKFNSELIIVRAIGYYHLLNNFGNVPIVDKFDVEPGYLPSNNANFSEGRKEVFEFIEKSILDNWNYLDSEPNSSNYGRINKLSAAAILLKLYINAKIWTGIARWDDVVKYADFIIDSDFYRLESNYFDNFLVKNENSVENIFVIPFDDPLGGNMNATFMNRNHHFVANRYLPNIPNGGWNGQCATPWYYESFDATDMRREGWLVGPMKDYVTGENLLCSMESVGLPLEYTVQFVNIYDVNDKKEYNYTDALEYHGARLMKYEYNYSTYMGNDLPFVRYADVLLLKAEALMWLNNLDVTDEVLELVNMVRKRAFSDNIDEHLFDKNNFDMEELLAERGREFYYECCRRSDLIRFNKFVRGSWPWYDRSSEEDSRIVFPIPQSIITTNNNLVQNPGY